MRTQDFDLTADDFDEPEDTASTSSKQDASPPEQAGDATLDHPLFSFSDDFFEGGSDRARGTRSQKVEADRQVWHNLVWTCVNNNRERAIPHNHHSWTQKKKG